MEKNSLHKDESQSVNKHAQLHVTGTLSAVNQSRACTCTLYIVHKHLYVKRCGLAPVIMKSQVPSNLDLERKTQACHVNNKEIVPAR